MTFLDSDNASPGPDDTCWMLCIRMGDPFPDELCFPMNPTLTS